MSISTFISYFSSLYCCKSPFNTNITRQGFPLSCQESYRTNEKKPRDFWKFYSSFSSFAFVFILVVHSLWIYFFGLFSFTNLFCAFVYHFLVFVSNIKCLTNGRFCFRLLFFVPNSFLLCWRFCIIITTKTRFYFTLTCYSFNPCRTFTIRNALLFSSCVSFIFN